MKQTVNQPCKSLDIPTEYDDFDHFYDENKVHVYKAIIEVFNNFLTSRKKTLSLAINAKIQGVTWNTDFTFNIEKDTETLMRDIMPYFIEHEMYEVCAEVKHIYDKLLVKNTTRQKRGLKKK
jgi:F0F1-type ATP synthase gamma subunit